jgi:hypothetical protein
MHLFAFNPRRHAIAAACLLMSLAAGSAQALSVNGVDATAVPGGNVDVVFNFDFGAATALTSIGYSFNWDASVLTLSGGSASYNGAAFDPLAVLGATGTYSSGDNAANGLLAGTWFALDAQLHPLPPLVLTGSAAVTLSFQVAGSLATPTAVTFSLDGADQNIDPVGPFLAQATVSAVPEPQSLALLLAGMGVVLGSAARRRASHSA